MNEIFLPDGSIKITGGIPTLNLELFEIMSTDPFIVKPRFPPCKHYEYIHRKLSCGKILPKYFCKKYNKETGVSACNDCVAHCQNE